MPNVFQTYGRQSAIKKLQSKQPRKSLKRYDDVHRMLWIFELTDEASWSLLNRCVQEFESAGKEVWLIGLVSQKTRPDYVVAQSHCCVCQEKDDFGFWGKPKSHVVERTLSQPYDLVVDTIGVPNFFSQYVALSAQAGLRIAYEDTSAPLPMDWQVRNTDVFDFVIRGDAPMDLRYYLDKVVEYLRVITK